MSHGGSGSVLVIGLTPYKHHSEQQQRPSPYPGEQTHRSLIRCVLFWVENTLPRTTRSDTMHAASPFKSPRETRRLLSKCPRATYLPGSPCTERRPCLP